MKVIKATIEDAKEILALQKSTFLSEAKINDDYDIEPLTQSLEQIKNDFAVYTYFKVVEDGEIVGAARGYMNRDTCFIGRIMVEDSHQNKGMGTKLLIEVEKNFSSTQRYELFTGENSQRNIYLYKKNGYKIFKTEKTTDITTLVYLEKINTK